MSDALKWAPKSRRFLAKEQLEGGFRWIEAWWDGRKFRIWCGNPYTITPEALNAVDWCDFPHFMRNKD